MRRSILILVSFVLGAIVLAGTSFLAGKCVSAADGSANGDDLAWLQTEFQLTDAEMARIRPLHEGYLPKCHAMCARIAEKQHELDQLLGQVPVSNDVVRGKLQEVASLRAQCQAQMLEHFQEVSQAMPADQGRRYLSEMRRLTLGSHERLEKSMAPADHPNHGSH